jgi:hypothetical protein
VIYMQLSTWGQITCIRNTYIKHSDMYGSVKHRGIYGIIMVKGRVA